MPTTSSAPTTPAAQRFTWTIGPTAPKTPAATAEIATAEPIYEGYLATYDDAARAPQAKNWESVMAKYASGQALTAWRSAWQSQVQYQITQKGTLFAAAIVEAAGAGVSVRACMDFSHTNSVDQAGNEIPMAKGVPRKNFAWLMTFQKVNGQMVLVNLVAKTPTGKTFPC